MPGQGTYDVDVDERGVEPGMAEVFFEGKQVAGVFEEVGGVAVSEAVEGDFFLDAGVLEGLPHDELDAPFGHGFPFSLAVEEVFLWAGS